MRNRQLVLSPVDCRRCPTIALISLVLIIGINLTNTIDATQPVRPPVMGDGLAAHHHHAPGARHNGPVFPGAIHIAAHPSSRHHHHHVMVGQPSIARANTWRPSLNYAPVAWPRPMPDNIGWAAPTSETPASVSSNREVTLTSSTVASSSITTNAPTIASAATDATASPLTQPTVRPVNLTELCAHANPPSTTIVANEKQLLAYVSSIEAVTGTIQELDDVVQQLKPKSCEFPRHRLPTQATTTATTAATPTIDSSTTVASGAPQMNSGSLSSPSMPTTARTSSDNRSSEDRISWGEMTSSERWNANRQETPTRVFHDSPDISVAESTTTSISAFVESSTTPSTESFSDPLPSDTFGSGVTRARRDDVAAAGQQQQSQQSLQQEVAVQFGMPSAPSSNNHDQAEDLAKAANDLRALRRDLSSTAEWLRQTNHTVHSALLRALVTYVSSIERRINEQRQLYVAQARMAALRSKVAVVKEKMTALLDKLSSLIPHKNNGGGGDPGSTPPTIGGAIATSETGVISNNRADIGTTRAVVVS